MTITGKFTGKRAFVTGATRGLGRTTAEWLAREGADLFISGREQTDIERAAAELRAFGVDVQGSPADLEHIDQVHKLAEVALATGQFDILVNNAGFSIPQPFLDVTDADWDAEFAVNVRAPFALSQHISQAMIANGTRGRIVNISTIGVFAAHRKQMVYDMAKAAVQTMTRNMGVELGQYGITVNCVAPGAVPDRPGFDMSGFDLPPQVPAGRWGVADDIANAVLFFCQDESAWVTGQTILIDGGHTLARPDL